ncbi:hypothetical protein HMPREF9520_02166 [Enterococcus faecalis TX1467]|nr:hypothetical protein HMPREF9520_02166 [Enterococcus faecalis TX1467]
MMRKIKGMTVFGTRPEAIKMAPLIKVLEEQSQGFDSVVVVTAQHRQMLDQVLEDFQITPNHDLNIMKDGQTLTDITSRVLNLLTEVLVTEQPQMSWFMAIQPRHLRLHWLLFINRFQWDMWKQDCGPGKNILRFRKK